MGWIPCYSKWCLGKQICTMKKELIKGQVKKQFDTQWWGYIASKPAVCPKDYNLLTKCMGTYCALLHILFGSRCVFFKYCMELAQMLTSNWVMERQCFVAKWSGLLSISLQQMSINDVIGVHPNDIVYLESMVDELKPHIWNQSPIFWSSFPQQWLTSTAKMVACATQGFLTQPSFPVVYLLVISAIFGTNSTHESTPPSIDMHNNPPENQSCICYIHPEVWFSAINPAPSVNWPNCCQLHCATIIFCQALVTLLQPAVTNFMTNGAPPVPRQSKWKQGGWSECCWMNGAWWG